MQKAITQGKKVTEVAQQDTTSEQKLGGLFDRDDDILK